MSVKIREIDHEDLNFMLTIENDKSNWKYGINKSELSLEDALDFKIVSYDLFGNEITSEEFMKKIIKPITQIKLKNVNIAILPTIFSFFCCS